jgi:hypothetical protein
VSYDRAVCRGIAVRVCCQLYALPATVDHSLLALHLTLNLPLVHLTK